MSDTVTLYAYDRQFQQSERLIGVDEAGRGPLAGPVVAAAVMLDLNTPIKGINDSKKVPAIKREHLYGLLCDHALTWSVGIALPEEIDACNILQATFLAMKRALDSAKAEWTLALIDGNQYIPAFSRRTQKTIIKGDAISASIAAASIIAKVTRDRIMAAYHQEYPAWDFQRHKGYPTERHRDIIARIGLSPIHRKTFCKKFVTAI